MAFMIDVSERVQLTPQQVHLWEETMAAFSWTAPAFTHLLYDMLNPDKGRVVATFLGPNKVPPWFVAGTNGKRLFLVAERFFQQELMERIFDLAHEVCHPMLGHIIASTYYRKQGMIELGFKKMPWSDELANFAQDYVINDLLLQSRIGKMMPNCLHDPLIGTFKDSWIDVYERLLKECRSQNNDIDNPFAGDDQTPGTRKGKNPFDFHLEFSEGEQDFEPDKPISKDAMEAEIHRAQQATAAALELARARGRLPSALEYMCEAVLEPVVDWKEHLKTQFARKLGTGGYDFRRPDRRLLVRDIVAPGRSGFRAEIIVMGADSSGSIYAVPTLIERWMAENSGIMEDVRPKEMHVVWCDAKIQRVDILSDPADVAAMYYKGAVGGGGTDFRAVFEYATSLDHPVDCLAYLTDGDGTFPDEPPPFPVIWGDISGNPEKYPFGDVVNIPVPR